MNYDTTTKEDRAKVIEEAKEVCRDCNGEGKVETGQGDNLIMDTCECQIEL